MCHPGPSTFQLHFFPKFFNWFIVGPYPFVQRIDLTWHTKKAATIEYRTRSPSGDNLQYEEPDGITIQGFSSRGSTRNKLHNKIQSNLPDTRPKATVQARRPPDPNKTRTLPAQLGSIDPESLIRLTCTTRPNTATNLIHVYRCTQALKTRCQIKDRVSQLDRKPMHGNNKIFGSINFWWCVIQVHQLSNCIFGPLTFDVVSSRSINF